jgi:hypothetical protein
LAQIRAEVENIIQVKFQEVVQKSQFLEGAYLWLLCVCVCLSDSDADFRELFLYGRSWRAADFAARNPSVDDFAEELAKCKRWHTRVEQYASFVLDHLASLIPHVADACRRGCPKASSPWTPRHSSPRCSRFRSASRTSCTSC